MGAAKKMKSNPRELAQKIIDNLDVSDIAQKTEIAGPGFINIHLKQMSHFMISKTIFEPPTEFDRGSGGSQESAVYSHNYSFRLIHFSGSRDYHHIPSYQVYQECLAFIVMLTKSEREFIVIICS